MNLTYVRGVTSDLVLKKSKRMKEFIKSTVLEWGQFDIEVLDTKTGRQFKLPTITGIFFNNKIDKETFCYTPVQSGSSQEGDRVDDCGYNVVFRKICQTTVASLTPLSDTSCSKIFRVTRSANGLRSERNEIEDKKRAGENRLRSSVIRPTRIYIFSRSR